MENMKISDEEMLRLTRPIEGEAGVKVQLSSAGTGGESEDGGGREERQTVRGR